MQSESDYDTSFLAEEGSSSLPGFTTSTDNDDAVPTRHFKMMHNIKTKDITKDDTDQSLDACGSAVSYTDDGDDVDDDDDDDDDEDDEEEEEVEEEEDDDDDDDDDDEDDDEEEYDDDNEVDASVTARRRKRVKLCAEELRLVCEWTTCRHPVYSGDVTTKNCNSDKVLVEFINHVETHAKEICDSCEETYECLWKDCKFETADEKEAEVHVNFHAYHTKLKSIGSNVKARTNMPECMYGKSNVNVLPQPLETVKCLWEDCTYVSNNMLKYLKHVDVHADKICYRLEHCRCLWKNCQTDFPNESKLKEHLRVHTREKVCACPHCGAMFASNTKLLDHCTRQLPLELQGFQCSHCRKHYPSERILRDHMRSHIKRYKCLYCDMTCATHTTLATHIRVRHIRHKPFRCRLCPFRCESKPDLLNHSQKHEMRDRYTCEHPDCEFTCRSNQTLKIHFLKEHKGLAYPFNIYECHECGKQYSRGTYLTTHLKKEHGLQWPSGHKRFAYRPGEDGKYRLQRIRYESLEVNDEIRSTEIIKSTEEHDIDDSSENPDLENKAMKIRLTMNKVSRRGKVSHVEYEMTIDGAECSSHAQAAHLERLSKGLNS